MLVFGVVCGSAFGAAPYKYEAGLSENLSKEVPGGGFGEPWGMAFDAAGKLYVIDTRGNAGKGVIDKFNANNTFQAQFGAGAFTEEFAGSVGVSEENGDLYAGELGFFAVPWFRDVMALSGTGALLSEWSGANSPEKRFGGGAGCVYVGGITRAVPSKARSTSTPRPPAAGK
jgi:hypothetical protein